MTNKQNSTVFAISTERITRFKHDKVFPIPAIEKYIEYSGIDVKQVTKAANASTLPSSAFGVKKYGYCQKANTDNTTT